MTIAGFHFGHREDKSKERDAGYSTSALKTASTGSE